MLVGKSKTFLLNPIVGQAGNAQIIPTNFINMPQAVHTVLGELNVGDNAEIFIDDGVDLEVAGSPNTAYLEITGVISYKV